MSPFISLNCFKKRIPFENSTFLFLNVNTNIWYLILNVFSLIWDYRCSRGGREFVLGVSPPTEDRVTSIYGSAILSAGVVMCSWSLNVFIVQNCTISRLNYVFCCVSVNHEQQTETESTFQLIIQHYNHREANVTVSCSPANMLPLLLSRIRRMFV